MAAGARAQVVSLRNLNPKDTFLENPRLDSKIQNQILRFFTKQINPRSLGSRCLNETEEFHLDKDSSVPLMG